MEADELAAVAGEGQYAAQCAYETAAVDAELVGIVLRNDAVVVGVAAFDEAARQHGLTVGHFCRALVEAYDDLLVVLAQDVLQQVGWLLGHDERCRSVGLEVEVLVAHQLMAVAGHHGQVVGRQVEVDAVHHGAQLVLCGGKERAVDVVDQSLRGELYGCSIVADGLRAWEVVGVLDGEVVRTVHVADVNLPLIVVDVDCQRLLGKLFHCIEDGVAVHAEVALALTVVRVERGAHGIFAVGSCYDQLPVVYLEEETVEYRQRVLAVDDLGKAGKLTA